MEASTSNPISYSNRPLSSSSINAHHHTRSMSRTTANALASLSGHDGNSSNTIVTSISTSSAQSLFLQTLRHLNIDQLYDSPTLTIASLNSDARTRIRTAEWSLYQLFRLYDPSVTAEKLQPFFPPLEPLQSVNLRAALFRCLNELKKEGLLGPRDTILRKSLLDECSGEKFWELCVVFAGAVMRKTVAERMDKQGQAATVAIQLATTQVMGKADRESMLPLAIAHKKALINVLAERQKKKSKYQRLANVLAETEGGLESRKGLAEQRARGGQGRGGAQHTKIAEEVLQAQWMGSEELRLALLDGDEDAAKDSIFTRPFETVWDANENDRLFSHSREDAGILEDLDFRTRHQRQRLRKWQTLHEKLAALNPAPGKDVKTAAKETAVRFDRHHDLRVDEDVDSNTAPPVRQERNISASRYDEILTAMREELRKNHNTRKASESQPAPPQTRKLSYRNRVNTLDATPSSRTREPPSRSASQTTVPIIRPGMSRRVSSQSRSYHQPKVISQREPIPLKSEIFSPLRSSSQSGASPISATHFVASPAVDDSEAPSIEDNKYQQPGRNPGDGHGYADSGVGFSMNDSGPYSSSHTNPYSDSGANSPKTVRWSTSSSSQADSGVDLPTRPILRNSNHGSNGSISETRPRTSRPSSLAERTRMSMALSSGGGGGGSNGSHDAQTLTPIEDPPSSQPTSSESDEPLNTLVERTRQSMSLAPQPGRTLSSKHRKSQSAQQPRPYPVNQFETPPRRFSRPPAFTPDPSSSSSLCLEETSSDDSALPKISAFDPSGEEKNNSEEEDSATQHTLTPRDALFDEDAAYASVFRSRPRIALSPVLSPTRGSFSLEEEEDTDDLDAGAGAAVMDDKDEGMMS